MIDPHTPSLIEVLNKFIQDANKQQHGNNLVLIADGLDRIVPVRIKDDTTNHDEIFIERSEQLTGLECHVIYTVPISMVYSGNGNDLLARYGKVETLPMVVVRNKGDRKPYFPGIAKLKELVIMRIQKTLSFPNSVSIPLS
ncbi:MAG: hypothetical protein QM487_09355 [Candidatus Marithrix sp.]